VCELCFNFTRGYTRCYACSHIEQHLDAIAPISYSVAHEQLHHALRSYKRQHGDAARRLTVELAAVLWRHLDQHEPCVAAQAGTDGFTRVTTVPSGAGTRDARHPLQTIVGELVKPTRDRYEPLLVRGEHDTTPREFDARKFEPTRPLNGEAVLLIDDTWTTGASANSAAAALKHAGASTVAVVVIGRHLNREWHENDRRIRNIAHPFDWSTCALCEKRNERG
jgi:predicted amidophosphoribosyltransferase